MKIELILLISMAAVIGCGSGEKRQGSVTGIKDGKLAECPDKPNCVSSMTKDASHFIEPFKFSGDIKKAKAVLVEAVKSQERSKIITDSDNYIHAEFTSKIMRFVDDVEFLFDDAAKTIHVRSASRVGYSDMGVNRKRVEALRKAYNDKSK